jgi:linoleate 10R-lipoxygenase
LSRITQARQALTLIQEHELYLVLAVNFIAIFFDLDTMKSFALQQAARAAANKLGAIVEAEVKFAKATGFASGLTDKYLETKGPLKDYGIHMVRHLLAAGLSPYEVAFSQMLPTAGAMVANQAQVVSSLAIAR